TEILRGAPLRMTARAKQRRAALSRPRSRRKTRVASMLLFCHARVPLTFMPVESGSAATGRAGVFQRFQIIVKLVEISFDRVAIGVELGLRGGLIRLELGEQRLKRRIELYEFVVDGLAITQDCCLPFGAIRRNLILERLGGIFKCLTIGGQLILVRSDGIVIARQSILPQLDDVLMHDLALVSRAFFKCGVVLAKLAVSHTDIVSEVILQRLKLVFEIV